MIHASKELVAAIGGVEPYPMCPMHRLTAQRLDDLLPACVAAPSADDGRSTLAYLWRGATDVSRAECVEDLSATNCPDCLRLMRDAVDPVRWDHLEERGLAPKLEAA